MFDSLMPQGVEHATGEGKKGRQKGTGAYSAEFAPVPFFSTSVAASQFVNNTVESVVGIVPSEFQSSRDISGCSPILNCTCKQVA